jgi:hypothetical protein
LLNRLGGLSSDQLPAGHRFRIGHSKSHVNHV